MQQTTTPAAKPQPAKAKPPEPPPEFQERAIATMDAPGLIRILGSSTATEFQKAKACQRAGELGAKEAIPALAALLADEHLSSYARYGLEPIAGPAADDALRAALSRLKGNLLIGVINSIGKRRDAKAIPALSRMLSDADAGVAQAAAAALGSIGTDASVKELRAALGNSGGMMKMVIADACLVGAERFLAAGKRDQALALYTELSSAGMPKPARLAAMQGIIREETLSSRPR